MSIKWVLAGFLFFGLPGWSAGQEPIRVGGAIKAPRRIKDARPVYPEGSRAKGVVILECVIGPDGRIGNIDLIRSVPELDNAAIEAVRQWEYEPTLLNGVAVPVIMTASVNFMPCFFESQVMAASIPKPAEQGTASPSGSGIDDLLKKARAEQIIALPAPTNRVQPVYPDIAKQARVRGNVFLEVTLGTDATLTDVKVVQGIPLLNEAATTAVKEWTFEPYELDGKRTPLVLLLGFSFCDVLP